MEGCRLGVTASPAAGRCSRELPGTGTLDLLGWVPQHNKLNGSGHLSPGIWCLQHPAWWLQGLHGIQEKASLLFASQPWILPASQETPV